MAREREGGGRGGGIATSEPLAPLAAPGAPPSLAPLRLPGRGAQEATAATGGSGESPLMISPSRAGTEYVRAARAAAREAAREEAEDAAATRALAASAIAAALARREAARAASDAGGKR
jgi:hypothetical protein